MSDACTTIGQVADISLEDQVKRHSFLNVEKSATTVNDRQSLKFGGRVLPAGSVIVPIQVPTGINEDMHRSIQILSEPAVIDRNAIALIPKPGTEARYLYYWLFQFDFRKIATLRDLSHVIEVGKLGDVAIQIPSLDEQRSVIVILDRVDRLLEFHSRIEKNLSDLVVSKFLKIFGNPATNSRKCPRNALKAMTKQVSPLLQKQGQNPIASNYSKNDRSLPALRHPTPSYRLHHQSTCDIRKNDIVLRVNSANSVGSQLMLDHRDEFKLDSNMFVLRATKPYGYGFLHGLMHFQWVQNLVAIRADWPKYQSNAAQSVLDLEVPCSDSENLHREFDQWITNIESIRRLHRSSETVLKEVFHSLIVYFYSDKRETPMPSILETENQL